MSERIVKMKAKINIVKDQMSKGESEVKLPRFIFNMDYFADYSSFNQFANDYHKFTETTIDPRYESLRKQNEIMRMALEFYADKQSQTPPLYHNGKLQADFTSPYRLDQGKKAREALSKCGVK